LPWYADHWTDLLDLSAYKESIAVKAEAVAKGIIEVQAFPGKLDTTRAVHEAALTRSLNGDVPDNIGAGYGVRGDLVGDSLQAQADGVFASLDLAEQFFVLVQFGSLGKDLAPSLAVPSTPKPQVVPNLNTNPVAKIFNWEIIVDASGSTLSSGGIGSVRFSKVQPPRVVLDEAPDMTRMNKLLDIEARRDVQVGVPQQNFVRNAPVNVLTGQIHHPISKTVFKALDDHPILKGHYRPRDPRFTTKAIDKATHNGYERWHIDLDNEVASWVNNNPTATPAQFESWLRWRYSQPDLVWRFPNGI
jgi:hypothetical protein